MLKPHPWTEYSNLLVERILMPRNKGRFGEIGMEEMRLVSGTAGNWVTFHLVIDTTDGVIADAKFEAFGESGLIGAADTACDVLLRKNYEQARRLTADLIDRKARDFPSESAFPEGCHGHLNTVLEAIEAAAEQCLDIEIVDLPPPVPEGFESTGEYPEWHLLTKEEKVALIKEVILEEIQPYIELDAGGVEVTAFNHDREIVIAYQGACTTCPSSTGATLNAIQQILRAKVHPELTVKPDLASIAEGLR